MRGVIVIIAFILSGCAAETATDWTRSGGRADDLPLDLYVCERWARHPESPNGLHMVALHDCMTARGWQETAVVP